jgi:hypothetical protein
LSTEKLEKKLPGKQLFVTLMGLTCLLIACIILLLWWAEKTGLAGIHPSLPKITGITLAVIAGAVVLGTVLLVLTTVLGKDILFTRVLRGTVIKLLLPAIESIGKVLGIPRDTIRQSFIAMNNSLVLSRKLAIRPDRLLILLPHCIQLFDCEIKVTGDIDKCVRCGRCDINGLAELAKKYEIDISVATGGTLARKVITEKRPKLVIAVACEGDLTSGIKDCYPLPVLGILNDRPFGPCFNTRVETQKIEEALKSVMGVQGTVPS